MLGVHGGQDGADAFAQRVGGVAGGLISRVEGHRQQVRLTAAWGIATWTPETADAETLFALAETALIANKHTIGRTDPGNEPVSAARAAGTGRRTTGVAGDGPPGFLSAGIARPGPCRRRTGRHPDRRAPDLRDQPGTTDLADETERLVTLPRGHLRKDGTVIPAEVSLRRVQTPRGEVIVNIVRDVRQRVAAEEAPHRHNRGLQACNDIAALLATSAGDPNVMVQMLAVVCRTLSLEGAALGQFAPNTGTMRITDEFQAPDPLRTYLLSRRTATKKAAWVRPSPVKRSW